jgi:hypothetical protein
MTIDQIIKYLNAPICADTVIGKEKQKEYDAHDSAVIILHKYQKIEQIIKDHDNDRIPEDYWYIDRIREVVEDGNDN